MRCYLTIEFNLNIWFGDCIWQLIGLFLYTYVLSIRCEMAFSINCIKTWCWSLSITFVYVLISETQEGNGEVEIAMVLACECEFMCIYQNFEEKQFKCYCAPNSILADDGISCIGKCLYTCTSQELCIYLVFYRVLFWLSNYWFRPYSSGLLRWYWGNHMIAPVPVNKPWMIWVKINCSNLRWW